VKTSKFNLACLVGTLLLLTSNTVAHQIKNPNPLWCEFNSSTVDKGGASISLSQIYLLGSRLQISANKRLEKENFLALSDADLTNYAAEKKAGYQYYLVRYASTKQADEISKSDLQAEFNKNDGTLILYSFSLGADASKYNAISVVVSLPSKLKRLLVYCESAQ
jgi:hypothetical protein